MSREFKIITNTGRTASRTLSLQVFCGPNQKPMLQLTQGFANVSDDPDEPGFVQLSVIDAYKLTLGLCEWVQATTRERAKELGAEIARNEALRKTVLQDAIDCGRFIDDLKLIEVPVRLLA